MISKFLAPGDKLELQMLEHLKPGNETQTKRIYSSQINDILSEIEGLSIYVNTMQFLLKSISGYVST